MKRNKYVSICDTYYCNRMRAIKILWKKNPADDILYYFNEAVVRLSFIARSDH